jgi:hypothetical protein
MTKLEAWKAWCKSAGTTDLATEFTLEQSSHGKAFSFAWDEAAKAERKRIVDMLLDMHSKEERHNYFLFIANIIKEMK